MKILFLLYDFYPNFGANSLIINNLSQSFIKKGHEVHILPLSIDPLTPQKEIWNELHIHRVTQTFDKKQVRKFILEFKILSAIKLLFHLMKERFNKKEYLATHWSYFSVTEFSNIVDNNTIDIVINVCFPFESSLPIIKYLKKRKKEFKWIVYMQDPFATNYYYMYRYSMGELLEFQRKVFGAADQIIVTDAMIKELKNVDTNLSLAKFKILDFPKIFRPLRTEEVDDIIFNSRYINCVYIGKFNRNTRNPQLLFQLFEALEKDMIRLHIIGEERDNWMEYLSDRTSNISFYGQRSNEVSINAELNSNILVNLGNNVSNQLPSKLLEYISTGKPILNLYKIENCPSLDYMDKYPVCLNVFEGDINFEKTLRRLRYFCIKYRNTNIKYQYISQKFYSSTLDYVSHEFLNLFDELINVKH